MHVDETAQIAHSKHSHGFDADSRKVVHVFLHWQVLGIKPSHGAGRKSYTLASAWHGAGRKSYSLLSAWHQTQAWGWQEELHTGKCLAWGWQEELHTGKCLAWGWQEELLTVNCGLAGRATRFRPFDHDPLTTTLLSRFFWYPVK